MRLLRAKFENFRMLRDLELEFSPDPDKKLAVIRAANESGKTTILYGLQWALYGDNALPDDDFRLHPIDWDPDDGENVPISVTIDFELTKYRKYQGETKQTRKSYSLVRSVSENVASSAKRDQSNIEVYILEDTGTLPMEHPEAWLRNELPTELREIFFTDGDRALSFIEADASLSDRRERVENAVRSLLGIQDIEDAIKHLSKVSADANKKLSSRDATDAQLEKIAQELSQIIGKEDDLRAELRDNRQQISSLDAVIRQTDQDIEANLKLGDKEEVLQALKDCQDRLKQHEGQLKTALKDHADLFKSEAVATELLASSFKGAQEMLEELHTAGEIPKITVPILQECLTTGICICGESLAPGKRDNSQRRQHIEGLIAANVASDEIREILTGLYYQLKPLPDADDSAEPGWLDKSQETQKHREDISEMHERASRELKAIEQKVEDLPDVDMQGLTNSRQTYLATRDLCFKRISEIEIKLDQHQQLSEKLVAQRDSLLKEQGAGKSALAKFSVIGDLRSILESSYSYIITEELGKVSELTNRIFLEMIGADAKQSAIIQRAEITQDFDIIVHGPSGKLLDPDNDLNGASRRALTLAFILALTKVSEVEAPNVIDTPLGMTSGYVRHAILQTAIRESSQLILLLTHDEIVGCEDILDEEAGIVITLTNPAHYPKILFNDPMVAERRTLRCDCDHRSECRLCKRRQHVDAAKTGNTAKTEN